MQPSSDWRQAPSTLCLETDHLRAHGVIYKVLLLPMEWNRLIIWHPDD